MSHWNVICGCGYPAIFHTYSFPYQVHCMRCRARYNFLYLLRLRGIQQFIQEQRPLDPDVRKVLQDKLWDLYEED